MNTTDEIIAVVQAFKEGKKIRRHYINWPEGNWHDDLSPSWDFCLNTYEVKPTPPCPRDLWIRPSLDGKTADLLPYDEAHRAEANWLLYKHVREVV